MGASDLDADDLSDSATDKPDPTPQLELAALLKTHCEAASKICAREHASTLGGIDIKACSHRARRSPDQEAIGRPFERRRKIFNLSWADPPIYDLVLRKYRTCSVLSGRTSRRGCRGPAPRRPSRRREEADQVVRPRGGSDSEVDSEADPLRIRWAAAPSAAPPSPTRRGRDRRRARSRPRSIPPSPAQRRRHQRSPRAH